MANDINNFVDKIFSINATASTTYGSAMTVGNRDNGMSSGSLIVNDLRLATAKFAKLMASNQPNSIVIQQAMKVVEGQLLDLQVMGQISNQLCNSLVDELYNFIK